MRKTGERHSWAFEPTCNVHPKEVIPAILNAGCIVAAQQRDELSNFLGLLALTLERTRLQVDEEAPRLQRGLDDEVDYTYRARDDLLHEVFPDQAEIAHALRWEKSCGQQDGGIDAQLPTPRGCLSPSATRGGGFGCGPSFLRRRLAWSSAQGD